MSSENWKLITSVIAQGGGSGGEEAPLRPPALPFGPHYPEEPVLTHTLGASLKGNRPGAASAWAGVPLGKSLGPALPGSSPDHERGFPGGRGRAIPADMNLRRVSRTVVDRSLKQVFWVFFRISHLSHVR